MPRKTTGKIVKLDDGKYQVRATAGYKSNGKRNSINRKVDTKREAEYLLKVFLQNAKNEKALSQNYNVLNLSIQDYFEKIFLPYKRTTLKPQSYLRLESTVRNQIAPINGQVKVGQLKSYQISDHLNQLLAEGKSHSTIKKTYDAYHAMYDYIVNKAHDMDPKSNPMDAVSMIPEKKFESKKTKWFTPLEMKAIKDECERVSPTTKRMIYNYGLMFMLIMNTGLREGEACALKKSDIDFKDKTITINKSVYVEKEPGGYVTKIGSVKYANSERVISVSNTALDYVSKLMKQFPETDMLIYTQDQSIVRPATLSRSFSRVLNNIGIDDGTLHSLRHTYVSILFDAGINIYIIAAQIGDNVSTVKKTYLHLYQKRNAAQVVNLDLMAHADKMLEEGITS